MIVKDVAGLVPGAYKGRGKGNRFLADLCDADVLVHVVDITGQADRDGNAIAAMEVDGSVVGASEDKGTLCLCCSNGSLTVRSAQLFFSMYCAHCCVVLHFETRCFGMGLGVAPHTWFNLLVTFSADGISHRIVADGGRGVD